MGTRHRITGLLLVSQRGLVVEPDSGGSWAIEGGARARRLVGRRVTVEGVRSGFDRLDIDLIALAAD